MTDNINRFTDLNNIKRSGEGEAEKPVYCPQTILYEMNFRLGRNSVLGLEKG